MNENIIKNSLEKCTTKLKYYKNISVSISGGADSDILLDIIVKSTTSKQVNDIHFIWFDTGLEYGATKEHIAYLMNKYGIIIQTVKPKKPIPICVKEYGEPFISKNVSEMLQRLQKHKFKWEDDTFEELYKLYPNCKSALLWWCNSHSSNALNIKNNKLLKEFIISHPPTFKISNKCCHHTKKMCMLQFNKENKIQLDINGVRKSEGGARAINYKSCFDVASDNKSFDKFRPIFWFNNDLKVKYENENNIIHSKCYSKYGLKRTGCAGCPFGRNFKEELKVLKTHEEKLYNAVINIFKNSYEYTTLYQEFKKEGF